MRARGGSNGANDRELVTQALHGGDEGERREAAAELLGRYRLRVYAWCLRHVGDHERALDLAQDVLLKAYSNLDTYRGRSPFVCWLWAIARNRCLSELRRPRMLGEDECDFDTIIAPDDRPDDELEAKQDEERLVAVMRECLTLEEQQALRLRCLERMPVDAVTRALGLNEASGARGVLQRARRKLRAALVRRGWELDGERP
jgi:RNA polymerase sigma-70 factor (ECF subfamily)